MDLNAKILIKKKLINTTLIILLLSYFMIGAYTVSPIEGDGMGIAMGAFQKNITGNGNNVFSHLYYFQSGSYQIVYFLSNLLSVNTFTLFSILSTIMGLVFILYTSLLLKKILELSFLISFLASVLFQEIFTGCFYPNSTILAAPFLVIVLYYIVTLEKTNLNLILAGLTMSIGVWFRYDLIIVSPIILFFLYDNNFKQLVFKGLFFYTSLIFFSTLFLYLCGTNPIEIYKSATIITTEYSGNNIGNTGTENIGINSLGNWDIKTFFSFYNPLILLLLFIGLFLIIKSKDWKLLIYSTLPVGLIYYFYFGTFTTPKYLYYVIPFLLIPILYIYKSKQILNVTLKKLIIFSSIFLFSLFYFVGFRIVFNSKNYVENDYSIMKSNPTFIEVYKKNLEFSKVFKEFSIVLGTGSIINTADANRLSTGIIYYPIMWYNLKQNVRNEYDSLDVYFKQLVNKQDTINIIATQYHSVQLAKMIVLYNNFIYQNQSIGKSNENLATICFMKGKTVCYVNFSKPKERTIESIISNLNTVNSKSMLYIATYPWEQSIIYNENDNFQRICNFGFLYEKF